MSRSRTYDIPYFLVDQKRRLRITALMQFLEDMAIRHSEAGAKQDSVRKTRAYSNRELFFLPATARFTSTGFTSA